MSTESDRHNRARAMHVLSNGSRTYLQCLEQIEKADGVTHDEPTKGWTDSERNRKAFLYGNR